MAAETLASATAASSGPAWLSAAGNVLSSVIN